MHEPMVVTTIFCTAGAAALFAAALCRLGRQHTASHPLSLLKLSHEWPAQDG